MGLHQMDTVQFPLRDSPKTLTRMDLLILLARLLLSMLLLPQLLPMLLPQLLLRPLKLRLLLPQLLSRLLLPQLLLILLPLPQLSNMLATKSTTKHVINHAPVVASFAGLVPAVAPVAAVA